MKRIKLTIILTLGICVAGLHAQDAVTSSGGQATGSGGTSSYTVGQIVYSSNSGTSGSVAHGVQQPYEISVVSGFEDAKDISLICSVYPNPTTHLLILKVENYSIENLRYHLYDIQGKLLESIVVSADQTSIDMNKYTPATYLINISTSFT